MVGSGFGRGIDVGLVHADLGAVGTGDEDHRIGNGEKKPPRIARLGPGRAAKGADGTSPTNGGVAGEKPAEQKNLLRGS